MRPHHDAQNKTGRSQLKGADRFLNLWGFTKLVAELPGCVWIDASDGRYQLINRL